MITITDESKKYLIKHIPEIETFLLKDDVNAVLDRIDDEIVANGLSPDQEYITEYGEKLQCIYDEVYTLN